MGFKLYMWRFVDILEYTLMERYFFPNLSQNSSALPTLLMFPVSTENLSHLTFY